MSNPNPKNQFTKGNTFGKGGVREGSGRQMQPSRKALREFRRLNEISMRADFKLLARLAIRPKEFEQYVIFGGKETDEQSDGKATQSRSGGYFLDPLFKLRVELARFRMNKYIGDPPKELDVNVDQTTHSIWMILKDCRNELEIQSHLENGSTTHPSNNGNGTHLPPSQKVVELPEQSVTVEAKQDSSQSPGAGIWSAVKKQE
jgi:hypothetical protein